jgi:hypothetical protein
VVIVVSHSASITLRSPAMKLSPLDVVGKMQYFFDDEGRRQLIVSMAAKLNQLPTSVLPTYE